MTPLTGHTRLKLWHQTVSTAASAGHRHPVVRIIYNPQFEEVGRRVHCLPAWNYSLLTRFAIHQSGVVTTQAVCWHVQFAQKLHACKMSKSPTKQAHASHILTLSQEHVCFFLIGSPVISWCPEGLDC